MTPIPDHERERAFEALFRSTYPRVLAYARAVAARAGETTPDERERLRATRAALAEDGVPVETYRRIRLDDALGLLAAQPALTARGA